MFSIVKNFDAIYYLGSEIRCGLAFNQFYHNTVVNTGFKMIWSFSSNNILELVFKMIEESSRRYTKTRYAVLSFNCLTMPRAFNMIL